MTNRTSTETILPGGKGINVSMGGEGAVLAAADGQIYESLPPKGTLVNAVGAGDSMVAGLEIRLKRCTTN